MKRRFFFLLYLLIPTIVLANEANKPSITFITKDNTEFIKVFNSLVKNSNYSDYSRVNCTFPEEQPKNSDIIFIDSENCKELLHDRIRKHDNKFLLVSYSTATSAKEIEKISDKALIIKLNVSSSPSLLIKQATHILLDILKLHASRLDQPDQLQKLQKEVDKFKIIRPEKAPLRAKAGVSDTITCEKDNIILQQGDIVKVDNDKLPQGNYIYVKSFLSASDKQGKESPTSDKLGKEGWIHHSLVEKLESK